MRQPERQASALVSEEGMYLLVEERKKEKRLIVRYLYLRVAIELRVLAL